MGDGNGSVSGRGFWLLIQGMAPAGCVLTRPFSLDTRLVTSVMLQIGLRLEK